MDFALTENHRLVLETTRALLKRFEGRRRELNDLIHTQKRFPQDLWDAIADAGLLGSLLPERYGGSDLGLLSLGLAVEEMARQGFGNALMILTAMDSLCILRNGSDELKDRFLPPAAAGSLKYAFAITEPDAGSNTFRIATFARKDGAEYVVSGQKVFITGIDQADFVLLATRTTTLQEARELGLGKAYGLSLFMVDTRSPGLTLQPIPTQGIEGMTQFTVFLDDVRVPAQNLVGEENLGLAALFNSLNPERILAAFVACGRTQRLLDLSCDYARQRKVFRDTPIGAHQAIAHPLAEIRIELEAARLCTYKAAWAFDQDLDPQEIGTIANMAKYLAAELAIKAADRAIQTHGGWGFSEDYEVIHHWTSSRLLRTAPISKEMILNFVAEHVLQLPRSY
jgi:alkylation response protein AidB-like acyl-CoA dehydrogenase